MSGKFTTARISIGGERFEILVKPEPALDYKMKKQVPVSRVLAIEEIYTDASKGTKASSEKLSKYFGTMDVLEISRRILEEGELQITTEQRRRLVEEKRRQIIAFISKNCMDPRTSAPHPPLRIEQALDQIKAAIHPFKDAEEQAKEIIEKLRTIMPIRMETLRVAIKLPPADAPKAYGAVKGYGNIVREEWQADGSWVGLVEVPAGLYGPMLERLGSLTQGGVQAKVIK
ncbi:MAG: ribosome assembly factor SBDS [Candidatus Bathyarchaeia archaeon]